MDTECSLHFHKNYILYHILTLKLFTHILFFQALLTLPLLSLCLPNISCPADFPNIFFMQVYLSAVPRLLICLKHLIVNTTVLTIRENV